MINSYAYDPYGEILGQQETVTQPFKFVGQFGVMAEPNGLYYMRARYYDPTAGRFISEDPIGFGGGDANLMAYVRNNPIMLADPLGLQVGVITPYGPIPFPYMPTSGVPLSPEQSYQMQQNLSDLANLFNPVPLLDWLQQQLPPQLMNEPDKNKKDIENQRKDWKCEQETPTWMPPQTPDPNLEPPPQGPWWKKLIYAISQFLRTGQGQ